MDAAGLLSGGSPVVKRYQVNASVTNRGVPTLFGSGTTNAGVLLATTTSAAAALGLALDTATYTTTQGTGSSSALRRVSIIINSDLIYRARINQGATEGTAETAYTVTVASSGGTLIQTGDDWNTTSFTGGSVFGYDGANLGQVRKITLTDTTSATVVIPFDYATVVGDRFLRCPWSPGYTTNVQLTTNLYEVDNSIVVGTGGRWAVIDLKFGDLTTSPNRNQSYLFMVAADHVFARL